MQLLPGLFTTELPLNSRMALVALTFQCRHLPRQFQRAFDAPRQTLPLKYSNFYLGHIEPTSVFGRVYPANASHQTFGFGWLESLVQSTRPMGIEVILHQPDFLALSVGVIHQLLYNRRVVLSGTLFTHHYLSPAPFWLDRHEQIASTFALVFVVYFLDTAFALSEGTVRTRKQIINFFIQTYDRTLGIVGQMIDTQHVFHLAHEVCPDFGDAPLLVSPGLYFVSFFFRMSRTLSWLICSITSNSTIRSASIRSVQRVWPCGAGEQAVAITKALRSPSIL